MATSESFSQSGSKSSILMYPNPAYEEREEDVQKQCETLDSTGSGSRDACAPDFTKNIAGVDVKLRGRSHSAQQLFCGIQPQEKVVHGSAVKVNIFKSFENVSSVEPGRRRRSFHEYLPASYVDDTLKMLGLQPGPSEPVIKKAKESNEKTDVNISLPLRESTKNAQRTPEPPKIYGQEADKGGDSVHIHTEQHSMPKASAQPKGDTGEGTKHSPFGNRKVTEKHSELDRAPRSSSERMKRLNLERAPWVTPGKALRQPTLIVPDLITGTSKNPPTDDTLKTDVDILERVHEDKTSRTQVERLKKVNREKAPWVVSEKAPKADSALLGGKERGKGKRWDRTEEVYQKCLEMLPRLREESNARMGTDKRLHRDDIPKVISLETKADILVHSERHPTLASKSTTTETGSAVSKDLKTGTKRRSQAPLKVSLEPKVSKEKEDPSPKTFLGGVRKSSPGRRNDTTKERRSEKTPEKSKKQPALITDKENVTMDTRSKMIPRFQDVMAIKAWNLQSLDVRMRLVAMDVILSFLLLTPLIILHYYATCRLLQCLFLDHFPKVGSWVLLCVGFIIEFCVIFFQRTIKSWMPRAEPNPAADNIPFTLAAKAYNYILAFGNICHMLAVTELLQIYVGNDLSDSFRATTTAIVLLWSLGCVRNILAAPLSLSVDRNDPKVFSATTLFETEPDTTIENMLDTSATVGVVYTFIHLHWMGIWNCFDAILFPNIFWLSMIVSVAMGYVLCTAFLVLQRHAREISQNLEKGHGQYLRVTFENAFLMVGNVGVVLLWKGLWMVFDLMSDYFPIYFKTCDITPFAASGLSFILLSLAHTSSSVLIKGCEIDGALKGGEGVCFPTGYFTELLKEQIEDMEDRDRREKLLSLGQSKSASASAKEDRKEHVNMPSKMEKLA